MSAIRSGLVEAGGVAGERVDLCLNGLLSCVVVCCLRIVAGAVAARVGWTLPGNWKETVLSLTGVTNMIEAAALGPASDQ